MERSSSYPLERLHACLGYALMDLGRYDDAEQCFHRAIEAGHVKRAFDFFGQHAERRIRQRNGFSPQRLQLRIEPRQCFLHGRAPRKPAHAHVGVGSRSVDWLGHDLKTFRRPIPRR